MAKVLLHSLVFSPDSVSTAYLMTDLSRQLEKLGHDVVVLTTTPHYNLDKGALEKQPMRKRWGGLLLTSRCEGITVWHIRLPMKGNRVYARVFDYLWFHFLSLIVGVTKVRSYDIVIAPSPPLTIGVIGWILARFRGVPFVYNIQEIYPDFAVNQGLIRNPMLIQLLKWVEQFVYSRSTLLVPISDWFGTIIKRRGVANGKLRVIPNFVDTHLYKPMVRANRFATEHQLEKDFVVLYGGNVGLSQDWISFLHAAETLKDLPIQFVVVGGGVRERWLESEVHQRGMKNVRLLGYRPRDLMPIINASSDLCTIPMLRATTTDTFPSKIYTIMACAKPVLVQADADSELNWLVTESRCGWVVPPEDPVAYAEGIRLAYDQRNALVSLGEAGRRFVEREYSKEAVGEKYSAIINELVRKNRNGALTSSSIA